MASTSINTHNLIKFIVYARIPLNILDDANHNSGTINPAYSIWLQKDQMLLSWLQSTLPILGGSHSHQLWNHLFNYFQKQTCAREYQMRVELCTITLYNSSFQYYHLKISTIINSLASIGDHVPPSHHINVIFEGLLADYA